MLALAGFVALCLLVAVADGVLTVPNIKPWYRLLLHPPLTPPDWVFGPVWTTLYLMMALAAWRVWLQPWHNQALSVWGWQLAFNAAWTPVFFAGHLPGPALAVILGLDAMIVLTIRRFRPIDPLAAWLMVPYLGWALFATYLNAGFWWLNR
ncbi:MAG TPA: TspO/MBR family protein [Acetobacteraceae bacterium]|nr:TspO/MBR family protein [Acetobacteraceae bacterium]